MSNTVYCILSSEPLANSILTDLRNLNVPSSDISVILPNRANTKNIAVEGDAIRGAEAGGLIGGIVGWLAGLSAMAIPGVGAFLIAGPLIAAFGGAVTGGAVGGLVGGTGAVRSLGLPSDVSARIEERLRHGDILIAVHSDNPDTHQQAVQALKAAGANDIYFHDDQAVA